MENKHSVKLRRGKTFLLIVCLLAFLLCSVTPIYAATTDNGNYASSLRDARQIAFIPAENEDGISVGYSDGDFCNMGPNSFAVENGMVYVLDTLNSRIITVKNGRCDIIALDEISYPKHMCLIGNTVYITDHDSSCMFAMKLADRSMVKYALPKGIEADDIYMLHMNKNGALELVDHDLKVYTWEKSSWQNAYTVSCEEVDCHSYRISGGEKKATVIETGDNTLAQFIDKSSKNVMVSVYEFVPDVPVIMFERTIRVYDRDGNVIGNTVVDDEDAYSHPDDDVYESSDGSIYIMHCKTDGVYITKPNLRKSYNSKMNSITAEAQEMCRNIDDCETKGFEDTNTPFAKVKRSQALNRASSCATCEWVNDSSKNSKIRKTPKVDVHNDYVYDDNGNLQYWYSETPAQFKGVVGKKTFIGIPYCRGGNKQGPATFKKKIEEGFTAGNVNCNANYIGGTAGLDCSGFVCYSYNSDDYYTSYKLKYEVGYYIGSVIPNSSNTNQFKKMKSMDYLVMNENHRGHVMLFVGIGASGTINVIHSTKGAGPDGKYDGVIQGTIKIGDLKNYYMKSPYSCTKTGCKYAYKSYSNTKHTCTCNICGYSVKEEHSFNYTSNQYTHYGVCKLCGFKSNTEAHTWVQNSNGKYICSVCGRESNVAYTPTSIDGIINNSDNLMD